MFANLWRDLEAMPRKFGRILLATSAVMHQSWLAQLHGDSTSPTSIPQQNQPKKKSPQKRSCNYFPYSEHTLKSYKRPLMRVPKRKAPIDAEKRLEVSCSTKQQTKSFTIYLGIWSQKHLKYSGKGWKALFHSPKHSNGELHSQNMLEYSPKAQNPLLLHSPSKLGAPGRTFPQHLEYSLTISSKLLHSDIVALDNLQ